MYEDDEKKKKNIIRVVIVIILIIIILLLLRGCKKEVYYTVTLKNGSNIQTILTDEKGFCKNPDIPTKDGYTFVGWYLNDEKVDFSEAFSEDIVLEARWEKNKEVEENFVENVEEEKELPEIEEDEVIENKPVKKSNKNPEQPQISVSQPTSTTIVVNEIIISNTSLELEIGSSYKLNATVKPENATNKNVIWSSSDSDVATVDQNGNVFAKKAGKVIITASVDGKNVSCNVNVKEITYSIEWKIEDGTAIDQYRLFIKGSNGKYVSGKIEITTIAGDIFEENISENGSENLYIKSAIQSVRMK